MINKACERIEGITKEDIGDKTISRLVEEGYYDKSVTLMVLDEKREVTELQRAKNGKSILVTGMPIYDDSGEIVRVIVNSRDITELMDLREQLRHKENLLNMYKEELNFYNMRSKFIANSKPMKMVIKTAVSVAKVNSNVLITGESGTGKSLVAEIIHKNSSRKKEISLKSTAERYRIICSSQSCSDMKVERLQVQTVKGRRGWLRWLTEERCFWTR